MDKKLKLTGMTVLLIILGIAAFLSSQITGYLVKGVSHEINIEEDIFSPDKIEVNYGEKVYWKKDSNVECKLIINSKEIDFIEEETNYITLDIGEYEYFCENKSGKGKIIVN